MNVEERNYLTKQMKNISLKDAIIIEVGSWKGGSSIALAKGIQKYCPSATLYCVDMFSGAYYAKTPGLEEGAKRNILKVFESNMKKYPHKTLVMDSLSAAKLFFDDTVSFVFIDADHSYEAVKADIHTWLPKLKKGCVMCGHDYTKKEYGVKKAVKEVFGKCNLPARSIWEIIK